MLVDLYPTLVERQTVASAVQHMLADVLLARGDKERGQGYVLCHPERGLLLELVASRPS